MRQVRGPRTRGSRRRPHGRRRRPRAASPKRASRSRRCRASGRRSLRDRARAEGVVRSARNGSTVLARTTEMCSVGSLVPSRTISCCALLPRRAPHALRPRQSEVLATQAASQLARRSIVRQVRGPRSGGSRRRPHGRRGRPRAASLKRASRSRRCRASGRRSTRRAFRRNARSRSQRSLRAAATEPGWGEAAHSR